MDSASDFGSGGWGFESPQGLFFFFCRAPRLRPKKKGSLELQELSERAVRERVNLGEVGTLREK